MAFDITQSAKNWVESGNIEPNLVFKIDGYDFIFSVGVIKEYARYGQNGIFFGMPGLTYGGLVAMQANKDFIALKGTSDTISQQIEVDKADSNSTGSLTVRLNDIGQEITELVTPGRVLNDILYKSATLSLGGKDTAYPEDYIDLFVGKITQIVPGPGYVDFTISHPDDQKRSEIFPKVEAELAQRLDFKSLTLQELSYTARPDFQGTPQIQYTAGASGDTANVSVAGNLITVQIDTAATKNSTIKKKIENNEDANQLTSVAITGNGDALATTVGITSFITATTATLTSTKNLLTPVAPIFRTYIRVNDEIIEYTSKDDSTNTISGLVRQSLTSFGNVHEVGDSVTSFYKLGDNSSASNAIDLALMVMISGGEEIFQSGVKVESFNHVGVSSLVPNALYFKTNVKKLYGLSEGDLVTTTNSINPSNDFTNRVITGFGEIDGGYYFIVSGSALINEQNSTAECAFKSQYNILPDGVGMLPKEIDIEQFKKEKSTFRSSIAQYEFYLKDTVNAKQFINEELFNPSGIKAIPRKGKSSCKVSSPPLYNKNSKLLDLSTIIKPSTLKPSRSVNKNFYNAIVWKFNEDPVDDKFTQGEITLSGDSVSRIDAPTKPVTVESKGLRSGAQTTSLISRITDRVLQRFQFGAESFSNVQVPFSVGWNQEIGDAVVFGGESLQITDTTNATRNFKPRVFEITNKSFNWRTGDIKLDLTDTNYSNNVRYFVWSPSSYVDTG